jgi:hypothetical protein
MRSLVECPQWYEFATGTGIGRALAPKATCGSIVPLELDAGLDLESTDGAGGCGCPLCSPKWRYKDHGFPTTRGSTIPARKCRLRVGERLAIIFRRCERPPEPDRSTMERVRR